MHIKKFSADDIVPLHYGDTIEILLCNNLMGEICIENNHFLLENNQIFVIPPNTVHSNNIKKCDGFMYVLKICFKAISNFINLPAIMEYNNRSIAQLPYTYPEYNEIYRLFQTLIDEDDDIFTCLNSILQIIKIFQNHVDDCSDERSIQNAPKNTNLRELIKWTHENCTKSITLDDVSKKAGYSKNYFCSLFKSMTGTTYFNYLNNVRISQACRLLKQDNSIVDVCYQCGFKNVPYFIQVFKKAYGITPKKYAQLEATIENPSL